MRKFSVLTDLLDDDSVVCFTSSSVPCVFTISAAMWEKNEFITKYLCERYVSLVC